MPDHLDLATKLSLEERSRKEFELLCVSPDDAKYADATIELREKYLSAKAEWLMCAEIQKLLLETRVEFGKAEQRHLDEVVRALPRISALNMALLEKHVTNHDQLAVLEELGRYVSAETKALLHPGTTSYDILDTARASLFRKAWYMSIRPQVVKATNQLFDMALIFLQEHYKDIKEGEAMRFLQTGRTHLQNTSPVPFGATLAGYAARLAQRIVKCDLSFDDLRGKMSGIVGTGAGIDMVIGEGTSLDFEEKVLAKLGLKPDHAATQIVQKESLVDVGNSLTTLAKVLADFANDIRILYSSAINEVTSRKSAEKLGGSSTDAGKNNPVDYENIKATAKICESGMVILYDMIESDLQRDLVGSKLARYQPQLMMCEIFETFSRLNKVLPQLSVNEDKMAENLVAVQLKPTEAMTTILRGATGWVHPQYGVGHDFVKKMAIIAQREQKPLLEVALRDEHFRTLYETFPQHKKDVLNGQLWKYIGSSLEKASLNLSFVRSHLP